MRSWRCQVTVLWYSPHQGVLTLCEWIWYACWSWRMPPCCVFLRCFHQVKPETVHCTFCTFGPDVIYRFTLFSLQQSWWRLSSDGQFEDECGQSSQSLVSPLCNRRVEQSSFIPKNAANNNSWSTNFRKDEGLNHHPRVCLSFEQWSPFSFRYLGPGNCWICFFFCEGYGRPQWNQSNQ